MAHSPTITIAYFTVVRDERTGWTGGLLLLSKGGRPLEFQCTLPVRPTRAHEILYGVTLRQHLIGEVIGPLLVEKCRSPISILCCDQHEAMAVSERTEFPVALVREACEEATDAATMATVLLAGSRLLVAASRVERVREIVVQLADLPDAVEPFERIREAIKEAQSQIARAPGSRPSSAA